MSINVTSQDLSLVNQSIQKRYVMIKFVNREMQSVISLKGKYVGGTLSFDDTQNVKSTGSLTMYVDNDFVRSLNKSQYEDYLNRHLVNDFVSLSMDKYLRIYLGIEDNDTADVRWYLQGTYILCQHGIKFDSKSRELTLSLSDRMLDLTGDRAGTLHAYSTVVKNSQTIRDTMINILSICGIDDYDIVDITALREAPDFFDSTATDNDNLVPYDIESNVGVTAYSLLDELVNLYPYYRMYFDKNGTFVCERKVTEEDDSYVVLDDKMMRPLIISESISFDTSKVKNCIEIWGKDGYYYGEAKDENPDSPFNINAYPTFRYVEYIDTIYDRYRDIEKAQKDLEDLASAKNDVGIYSTKENPTNEDKEKLRLAKIKVNQLKQSLSSNIKIKGDDMAKDWAEQKLYEMCRLEDTVTLDTILLPFINDTGFKFSYRSKLDNKVRTYKVKSISHNLGSNTTTIVGVRFYNDQVYAFKNKLDKPTIVSIGTNGMSITVSVNSVPFAEKYTLYIDYSPVTTSTGTTLTYTLPDKFEGTHQVFVSASAENFMDSGSDVKTIDFSASTRIVTNNGNYIITNSGDRLVINELR